MTVAERLRDNDEDWGATRIEYAQRHKRLLRERYRARREARNEGRRAIAIVDAPEELPVALHRTKTGRIYYQVQRHDGIVSLPWISILESAA